MTEDEVRALIRQWIGARSMTKAAKDIGISVQFMSMVLSGAKLPSGKMLDAIGVQRRPAGRNGPCFNLNPKA